jgi:hypothetical protein
MIDIERLSPSAHRIVLYGEITREDIAAFIAFVKAQDSAGEGGNVLFDFTAMAGIPPLSAVTLELANMAPLMRWTWRLDRIAVISDDAWMRSASRLESMALPGITYQVYDTDEAEAARAWVLEQSDRPHAGILTERDCGPDVAVFELAGRIDRAEAEAGLERVRARLDATGATRLMMVIRKWHGFEPETALSADLIRSKLALVGRLDRYALVGGPAWLRGLVGPLSPLITPDTRAFALDEEEVALAWLRS